MTTTTLSSDTTIATPDAPVAKTYPLLGLLLIVLTAGITYGGLYLALRH